MLTLPDGTQELNRVDAREGRIDIFFAEFLVPAGASLDFAALRARATAMGYTHRPGQGGIDGVQLELRRNRGIIESIDVFLVETGSKDHKFWVAVSRFTGQ